MSEWSASNVSAPQHNPIETEPMFHAHGWIQIEGPARLDELGDRDTRPTPTTLGAVNSLLLAAQLGDDARVAARNGSHVLQIDSRHNHAHLGVTALLAEIGAVAPESFGLVHVWDDESDLPNEWVCFAVVRGAVEQSIEDRLSPVVPRLMDD